jgi:ATP-dependent Clp protease ATP-binding subunit ClpC
MSLSPAAQIVLELSESEALQLKSDQLDVEHVLIGLFKIADLHSKPPDVSDDAWAAATREVEALGHHLKDVKITPTMMRRRLRYLVKQSQDDGSTFSGKRAVRCQDALRRAEELAGSEPVSLLNLLLGCLEQPSTLSDKLFAEFSVNKTDVMRDASTRGSDPGPNPTENKGEPPRKMPESPLAGYGRDLTAMALEGVLAPVIGRRDEMKDIARILSEKLRPNVMLVGDPGVGKTAIVEGLARYAASPDAHPDVKGYHFVEITMDSLIAGGGGSSSAVRRLTNALEACKKDPNLVLFIDEFHTMVQMGAADLLKPSLGRGEVHLIGATTVEEFHKYIEPDQALSRRLVPVWVDEPSRDETVEILRGLLPTLEEHHNLSIPDDAVVAAVDLTSRFMSDGHMPDKALTVLDQACARHRLKTFTPGPPSSPALERDDVGEVLAARTNIPAEVILMKEDERWLRLEDVLSKRVIGQPEAVSAVAETIRQSRAGLRPERVPPAFLFAGPSGTGKTELAKALSAALFLDEDRLIRIDMTEYRERHSAERFRGSPPGYIGSDETPPLVRDIQRHPYSVVLMDEIEKAHPEVLNVFLPVFDEGRLVTAKGIEVDFSHAVFVMTSNLGSGSEGGKEPGFHPADDRRAREAARLQDQILDAVRGHLTPEFFGRINRVVVFQQLSRESVFAILDLQLNQLNRRAGLTSRGIELVLDESAKDFLMERGYSTRYGARELMRTLEMWVVNPLSRALLSGDVPATDRVLCHRDGDKLAFDFGLAANDQMRTLTLAPQSDETLPAHG